MEKTRHRVNAKAFVEYYRAGVSEEDLMRIHGLDKAGLGKLVKLLLKKGFLEPSDIAMRETLGRSDGEEGELPDRTEPDASPYPRPKEIAGRTAEEEPSLCPQCSAQVSVKALICPECGHVLPGEERWAAVEPPRSLSDRIPPKILGILLALPLALLLFFLFRDFFIPAAKDAMDRRSGAIGKRAHGQKAPAKGPVAPPKEDPAEVLDKEVHRLIAADILSSADEEGYRRLVVGSAWFGLGMEEKARHLARIRTLLIQSGVDANFEVVDLWGETVARVTNTSVDLVDKDAGAPPGSSQEESSAPPRPPAGLEEVIQRSPESAMPGAQPAE
jgi:hypothetical protein